MKYTVLKVVGPNAVKLNTPGRVHPVFNVNLLRLASSDPLPSQPQDDNEPEPIEVNGEAEYVVEEIVDERVRGRGKQFLVKWEGYPDPTWEPAKNLEDTQALEIWEEKRMDAREVRLSMGGGLSEEGGTVRG